MSRKKKVVLAIALPLLLIVAAVCMYVGYFALTHRALPGTYVGEIKVTGLTEKDIKTRLTSAQSNNTVTISGEGINTTTTNLSTMGFAIDSASTARHALAANSQWTRYFSAPFVRTTIEPAVSMDPAVTLAFSQQLTAGNPSAIAPVNPRLEFEGNYYIIKAGSSGSGVHPNDLHQAAIQVAATCKDVQHTASLSEIPPLLSEDDLEQPLNTANAIVATPASISFNETVQSVTPADIATWLQFEGVEVSVNADAATAWVQAIADSFAVQATPGMRYLNSSGTVVKVKNEPVQGVVVNNVEDVATTLITNLNNTQETHVEFNASLTEPQWNEKIIAAGAENLAYLASEGEKWVDINLSDHRVRLYSGATLMHTLPMINGSPATPTRVGEFAVYLKYNLQTMRGTNLDGSKYITKDVPWVTYFDGDIATHGSSAWRSAWGYDAGYGGSHGCVNMSNQDAKIVFDFAPLGTPVMVHR